MQKSRCLVIPEQLTTIIIVPKVVAFWSLE